MKKYSCHIFLLFFLFCNHHANAQEVVLDTGWKAQRGSIVNVSGEQISNKYFSLKGWLPATVPGTVLTTLLNNKLAPDPFYGMNNNLIPDVFNTGGDQYTYWFVNDFRTKPLKEGRRLTLHLRGVNYSFLLYINEHVLTPTPRKGMYKRHKFDITPFLNKEGVNRIAILVYPPDHPGNPNGGQGGDGTIARDVTNQYTAGWDWIQPVRDRNTGIWDKIYLEETGPVSIDNTYVSSIVPGTRTANGIQQSAIVRVATEINNISDELVEGDLVCEVAHEERSLHLKVPPHSTHPVAFPDITVDDPKLWWPNGYGPQTQYKATVEFRLDKKNVSDEQSISFGIREIKAYWNSKTQSREISVNGQKIFIKGSNWITSDAMLRNSRTRYDNELRYHRDMNLNFIRVWGGGLTERPEFYEACDKYGILVMQDLWVTGDCNGRWYDPYKHDDTTTRRNYPDDHKLFMESVEDQVKMLRCHPSLAIWCGGNEIRPPADILADIKNRILPQSDPTRYFFEYSNADSMSLNSHDGPYTLQDTKYFWEHRSYPFNSEIGSVGLGEYESLERFLPKEHMIPPYYSATERRWKIDSVWKYHKYLGYDSSVEAYGHITDLKDFTKKVQLVNYDQYRAMMEGAVSHAWDWYTGILVWKTQNPWTAMVGQMYDPYLDPNAGMFGLREGAKPLHIMYDPIAKVIKVTNNTYKDATKVFFRLSLFSMDGAEDNLMTSFTDIPAHTCKTAGVVNNVIDEDAKGNGQFADLTLIDAATGKIIDDNFYWFPDSRGNYSGLIDLPKVIPVVTATITGNGTAEISITAPAGGSVAFFNRLSLTNKKTGKLILPAFFNNNYISIPPGQHRTVLVEWDPEKDELPAVIMEGWNVEKQVIDLKK